MRDDHLPCDRINPDQGTCRHGRVPREALGQRPTPEQLVHER
jgi:hypothetical protein